MGHVTVGLRSIASALVSRPIRLWVVGTIAIIIVVAGFLAVPQTLTVNAAPESTPPSDCKSCHTKTLKFHDKLGSGNKACWVCHDNTDIKMLRLADGSPLSLTDSSQLCGQCHQQRYGAWKEGTHGIPGPSKEKCTSCHNPHQPQIVLSGITRTHPVPRPPSPPPPVTLLAVVGISFLVVIAVGVVVLKKGEWPWSG